MLGLGLSLSLGNPLFGGGVSEAAVKAGAGVPATITPGVLIACGQSGASLTSDRRALTITQRSDISGAAGVTGTGTYADPYTLTRLNWFSPNTPAAGPHLVWNDPDADYWIRVYDSTVNTQQSTYNVFEVDCGLNAGLILERCTLRGQVMVAAQRMVQIASGYLYMRQCLLSELRSFFVRKTGANAHIVWEDSEANNSLGQWNVATPYFINEVSGGSLTINRVTQDYRKLAGGFMPCADLWSGANWTVTVDRLAWRPQRGAGSNDTGNGGFLSTVTGADPSNSFTTALTSPVRITNSRIYTGATATYGTLIGTNNATNGQSITDLLVEHCDLIAPGTSWSGARLVAGGNGTNTDPEHTKNHRWRWCRFSKPQTTGIVAGNEVIEYWRSSDITIEYCWVDSCGEDAYEYVQPYRNPIIRYCGGGEVSGSKVGGNMVDFYGGGANWANSTGCQAHHIWGSCGGDAVIVDSCVNVAVNDIDIDNVAGGFVQNPPAANVRLHSRTTNGLNGVTVSVPLSAAGISFASKPCELTYESGAHDAGTVVWPEWNGSSFDTRGGSDGIVDGM